MKRFLLIVLILIALILNGCGTPSTNPDTITDTTTPTISGIAVSNIAATSVTITWMTSEASTSQVIYGSTTSYGQSTTLDTTKVTSHSITLSGISAATTYHYMIKSKDASNNEGASGDNTFITLDNIPPVISGVATSSLTATSVTVTWTTDESSTTQVEYGTSTSYGTSTTLNTTLTTSHSAALSGLTGLTTYHYRIKSKDASNNESMSADNTFTTLALPEILTTSNYIDNLGYFNIVGEAINNLTTTNIKYVKIVATFYDSGGVVIGTDFAYTAIDIMKPGQKSPFELSTYPDKITPASFKLSLQWSETGDQPLSGLNILSYTPSYDSLGYYEIVGEVKNQSTSKATFVKLICTFYDSTNIVIGYDYTFTNPNDINAGDTAPFKLNSYPRKLSPHHYILQVEG